MPRKPVYDPDWAPADARFVLRVTARQLGDLDAWAREFGVSRSWLVRRALRYGLPPLLADLREAYAQGLYIAPSRGRPAPVRGAVPRGIGQIVFTERPPASRSGASPKRAKPRLRD